MGDTGGQLLEDMSQDESGRAPTWGLADLLRLFQAQFLDVNQVGARGKRAEVQLSLETVQSPPNQYLVDNKVDSDFPLETTAPSDILFHHIVKS